MLGDMTTPVDQGAILHSGAATVPNYLEDQIRQQLANAQSQHADAESQAAQTGADTESRLMAHDRLELNRRNQFGVRMNAYLRNPTMAGMGGLMGDFPEYHEPLKQLHDMTDQSERDTDLRQLGDVFGAVVNNEPAMGATRLRERITADRAAGQPTQQEEAVAGMLESGDPDQITRARGMLGYELAMRMGPEHFAGALERMQPPEFERYAQSMGLTPGTPEYRSALQDYVLRGSGPTSHGFDSSLEAQREAGRVTLEGVQQSGRAALEAQRQAGRAALQTSGEANVRTRPPSNVLERVRQKIAAGQPLSPGEQRIWDGRPGQGRAHGRAGGVTEGAIISNPRTGQRMQLRGGQWVPIQ